jgi:lysophospholipase L1-like esterase
MALALGLVVAAIAGEILLRVRFGAPRLNRRPIMLRQANKLRGWQMVPHQSHYTYDRYVTLNELGFRGPPVGDKRPGDFRVLALGDSMVYGQGVGDRQTIPWYLEQRLRALASGRAVQVINSGHRGYATHEELALLEEQHARLQPDLVILYWYWNDLMETDIDEMYQLLSEHGPAPFDSSERLEGAALWRWRLRQLPRHSALVVSLYELYLARSFDYPTPEETDQALARLDGYLERMVAIGKQDGFKLLVAIVPDAQALEADHFSLALARRVEAIAHRHHIPTLDLLQAVRAVAEEQGKLPIIPYDGHYLAPANRAMAEATAERLVELGWWPTEASGPLTPPAAVPPALARPAPTRPSARPPGR